MVENFRSWTEANKAVPSMTEEQAEDHLRSELARPQPRKNFVARFYGRFANMRRKREQAEIGIEYFYREGWPGYNEEGSSCDG
jgi:hypothetical protein